MPDPKETPPRPRPSPEVMEAALRHLEAKLSEIVKVLDARADFKARHAFVVMRDNCRAALEAI